MFVVIVADAIYPRSHYPILYTPHKILIFTYTGELEFLSCKGDHNTFGSQSLVNLINVARRENPFLKPQSGL